jgi:hypothetical protein
MSADGLFAVLAQGCRQRSSVASSFTLDELFQPLDTTDSHYRRRVRFRQKLLKVISAGPPRATSSVVRRHSARRDRVPFTPLRTPPRTASSRAVPATSDTSSQVHSAAWYPASLRYLL